MKTSILALVFVLSNMGSVLAQPNCSALAQKVLVVFGNGILASEVGVTAALTVLRESLGDEVNGQKISYDIAYNQSYGAFLDLLQAFDQHLTQYTSEVMSWLQGSGVAPGWFIELSEKLHRAEYRINAPELNEHVRIYRRAIDRGQKVLVVAHSQGNFYVNQAKQLLSAIRGVEMTAFGILAVATPANNVGGASSPYFTNDRDIVSLVPGALPANWRLQSTTSVSATNLDRIAAHSFVNTYMSPDFDLRGPIVFDIKGRLIALKDPPPNCNSNDFRKHFVGLLAGTYSGYCDTTYRSVQAVTISRDATVSFPDGIFDLTSADLQVGVHRWPDSLNLSAQPDIKGGATDGARNVGGTWSADGRFKLLVHDGGAKGCVPLDAPATYLPKPVDIGAKVAELLDGYRGGFLAGQCALLRSGVAVKPPAWTSVTVEGGRFSFGEGVVDLKAASVSESAVVPSAYSVSPVDPEPRFSYVVEFANADRLTFSYSAYRGLQAFNQVLGNQIFGCQRK